jgi:dTDP-4-dehydrorhamnose reductase
VLKAHPHALVLRTSAFFGPWDRYNFVTLALNNLTEGRSFTAAGDVVVSPTYVPNLVQAALDLLIDGENGIWHLANAGAVTWAELAIKAARMAGLDHGLINVVSGSSLSLAAPRPAYSALASERGQLLPSLDAALAHYLRERTQQMGELQTEFEATG